MASTNIFCFATINSSKTNQFHHGKCLTIPHRSSKVLCTVPIQADDQTRRPSVDFPPSLLEGHFMSYKSDLKPNRQKEEKIENLKKEVKSIFCSAATDPSEQLVFIDKIQRLGIEYHFEAEIDKALQNVYDNTTAHEDGDLEIVALRFRLLRQAGHFVSPGVFSKFKEEKGEFNTSLRYDLEGLLSLYEASYLSCKDETILDEAISFTTQHLKSLAGELNLGITSQVRMALDLPLRKRITRIEAPYYMSIYKSLEESENDVLLQLAILDYNALQLLHQREMNQLSRWWKESKILSKLPFQARDKLVECFAVVASIMPEPKYSTGRLFNAKYMALFNVIDDIFDVYGTISELQPITDALSRWDVEDTDDLPGYAKMVLIEIFNVFNEIEEEMETRGLEYTVPYFKRQAQCYIKFSLAEANLFHSNEVPTLEKWLQISTVTIGVKLMNIGYLLGQWDLATQEAMEWSISDDARINHCSGRCGRMINDINTFKFEQERGNMASSVACYMKEHGVQEHEAIGKLRQIIDQEWKKMNQECLNPTTILPLRLLMIPINTIRMFEFVYRYSDGYTNSGGHVKEAIAQLLVNPVPN